MSAPAPPSLSWLLLAALVLFASLISFGGAEPSRPEWKTSFLVRYAGTSQESVAGPNITHSGHMGFHALKNRVRVNDQASDATASVSIFDFDGSRAYLFTGVSATNAVCTEVNELDTRVHPSPFQHPCNQDQTRFLGTMMLDGTVTYAWSNCKMHLSHRVSTPSADLYTLHVDAFTGAPVFAYSPFETFTFNSYQEMATPVDSYFYIPQEYEGPEGVCNSGKLIQPRQWWPLLLILVVFLLFVICIMGVIAVVLFIFRYHIKSLFTGEPLPENAVTLEKIKGIFKRKQRDQDEEHQVQHDEPTI